MRSLRVMGAVLAGVITTMAAAVVATPALAATAPARPTAVHITVTGAVTAASTTAVTVRTTQYGPVTATVSRATSIVPSQPATHLRGKTVTLTAHRLNLPSQMYCVLSKGCRSSHNYRYVADTVRVAGASPREILIAGALTSLTGASITVTRATGPIVVYLTRATMYPNGKALLRVGQNVFVHAVMSPLAAPLYCVSSETCVSRVTRVRYVATAVAVQLPTRRPLKH